MPKNFLGTGVDPIGRVGENEKRTEEHPHTLQLKDVQALLLFQGPSNGGDPRLPFSPFRAVSETSTL